MDIFQAIKQRHSIRRYSDTPIDAQQVARLNDLIDECNSQAGLNIQLVLDEPKAFASKLVHYGAFSGVRNYIAMIGPADDPKLDEKLGYYGEKLVLEAQMMGLGTCWVALTYRKNRKAFVINDGEKLRCVISVGYGTEVGKSHKIKTIGQVSECDGPMPDWFRRGVEAALLAPTAVNQQKFVFRLEDDNRVKAYTKWGFYPHIDLGIAKYHFEVGAGDVDFSWVE